MTQISTATAVRTLANEIIYPERGQMITQILEIKPDHLTDKLLSRYSLAGLKKIYRCRVLGRRVGRVETQA